MKGLLLGNPSELSVAVETGKIMEREERSLPVSDFSY